MRTVTALLALAALAGCTEITTFRHDDGGTSYLANCEKTTRLETCRGAMARVCPAGYDITGPAIRNEAPGPVETNQIYFRCRG